MSGWFLVAAASLAGCTDYGINSKTGEQDVTPEPPPPAAPVAVTGPGDAVKRGIEVQLDGTASYDPDDDGAILEYAWITQDFPELALVQLVNENTSTPLFSADTVGIYQLDLMVIDEEGQPSVNPASTVVEILPWTDMELVLTWDRPKVDLDLHLLAPEGAYFEDSDCFYGNPTPDWGVEGDSTDDPELINDNEGTGAPEVIRFPNPGEGTYSILVPYHSKRDAQNPYVTPTLSVRAEGAEIANLTGPRMYSEGTVWIAGTLDWSTLDFVASVATTDHSTLGGPDINE
jgi:hypothetical protein